MNMQSRGLTEFPDINGRQCVMLKRNRISRFPSSPSSLQTVNYLDVSENQIKELPEDFSALTDLEVLDVSNNQIASLSPSIRFPASFRALLLAGNQLTTLPAGLQIPSLFVLDLSNNNFPNIPPEFCVSNQLTRVDFTGNKLKPDTTMYMNTLNKCRNVNKVPFCIYVDHRELKCDCDTLYPVFGEVPSFCMGTPLRGQAMMCNPSSSEEYQNKKLFELKKAEVSKGCNFALRSQSGGNSVTLTPITMVMALGLMLMAGL